MTTYFVDTWYFIAIVDRYDQHYATALRLERRIAGSLLLTHEYVLGEFLTYFSGEGALARARAVEMVRASGRSCEVVESNHRLFDSALYRYSRRLDKEYSFVDCMSMVLMERRGITHVLTNDHHFRQEGFILVNE
ncbi:MAG TPA: PIN domain-containing protein [Thermoanaerobaculia bacterium]|nr:PIN domain-containing protein [Thermoanaerobaculia bacterium]